MGYLISADYNRLIQDVALQQIISGNLALKVSSEITSISQMKSYLRAKYDVDQEFSSTQPYNPLASYAPADRVYLDALAYSSSATYTVGQLALQAGKVYQNIGAINVPEVFDIAKWSLLGDQFTIFYANYPYPLFNIGKVYLVGDQVFWKGHIYTCKIQTSSIDHQTLIQYQNTARLPFQNVFPDDLRNGPSHWTDNGSYLIPPGNLLTTATGQTVNQLTARADEFIKVGTTTGLNNFGTVYVAPAQGQPGSLIGWDYTLERIDGGTMQPGVDYTKGANGFNLLVPGDLFQPNERFAIHFIPIANLPVAIPTTGVSASQIIGTYFTMGDNRNQEMVLYCLDIAIYNLYSRIPPQVIPENRTQRYQVAIMWLKTVAKGEDVIADIPKLQPVQGDRIRFGSRPKLQNNY